VFRHFVQEAGLAKEIAVDSAGTQSYHTGERPDERSLEAAIKRGYNMKNQVARRLQEHDFQKFDLLLAMDRGHLRHMTGMAPGDTYERVKLFLSYAPSASEMDVPDPYYGDDNGLDLFEQVLDLVEDGCTGLLHAIRREFL
jgi:protein-tyrosine phosphatase